MQIEIGGNEARIHRGTQNIPIFQLKTPHSKLGIFWWTEQEYLGGWLKLPLACTIEFEAASYTVRRIGQMTTLEILVETKDQLFQLAHQLSDHLDNWRLPVEISSDPPTNEIFLGIESEISKFLIHLESLHNRINADMTLKEAYNNNWKELNQYISNYRTLVRVKDLPEKFHDRFLNLQSNLANIEPQFRKESVLERILERNVVFYSKSYEELAVDYEVKMNLAGLSTLQPLLKEVRQRRAELQDFWDTTRQMMQNERIISEYVTKVQPILNDVTKLVDRLQDRCHELEKVEQQKNQQKLIERTVLQQLQALTPGIQILLVRISELTGFPKDQVESTIIQLLEKHSNLGVYDQLSQVFIPGANMPQVIERILKEYPRERSVEELLVSLEHEKGLTTQELHYLVNNIYNKLEKVLRTLVPSSEKQEFLVTIDLAHEQGLIKVHEQDQLHQFRKNRNELIHGDLDKLPGKLIQAVAKILKRLGSS